MFSDQSWFNCVVLLFLTQYLHTNQKTLRIHYVHYPLIRLSACLFANSEHLLLDFKMSKWVSITSKLIQDIRGLSDQFLEK